MKSRQTAFEPAIICKSSIQVKLSD